MEPALLRDFPLNIEIHRCRRGGVPRICGMEQTNTTPDSFDTRKRYVRIREEHANGMVEFEFAVGEPHLYVEMVMPRAEFEQFCKDQGVTPTVGGLEDAEQGTQEHEWDWNVRAARDRHFRHEP